MATSARETFAARTAEHAATIKKLRLTEPQKRDLVKVHNGEHIADTMFSRLSSMGLVREDLSRPFRTALTDLGTAYVRRPKF